MPIARTTFSCSAVNPPAFQPPCMTPPTHACWCRCAQIYARSTWRWSPPWRSARPCGRRGQADPETCLRALAIVFDNDAGRLTPPRRQQGRTPMSDDKPDLKVARRDFLSGVGIAGAAAALSPATPAMAQTPALAKDQPLAPQAAGYTYFKPTDVEFIEAVVDHMVPTDELTPSGPAIGIATYIDRALAGSWGKGDRLYMQGPWGKGTPNQGYQLPLTPAALYRAAIAGSNVYCRKTFGQSFERCSAEQKETFLKDLQAGKITLEGGLPGRVFFGVLYENVMEGMFSDPIYGGNKDKVGWKLVGFPGVMANNAENARKYNDGQRFAASPVSIADMS